MDSTRKIKRYDFLTFNAVGFPEFFQKLILNLFMYINIERKQDLWCLTYLMEIFMTHTTHMRPTSEYNSYHMITLIWDPQYITGDMIHMTKPCRPRYPHSPKVVDSPKHRWIQTLQLIIILNLLEFCLKLLKIIWLLAET